MKTSTFKIGQIVRFYVKRFRKWYEGKVEGREQDGDLKGCYNIRVTKSEGPLAQYEIGNLWAVDPQLIREVDL